MQSTGLAQTHSGGTPTLSCHASRTVRMRGRWLTLMSSKVGRPSRKVSRRPRIDSYKVAVAIVVAVVVAPPRSNAEVEGWRNILQVSASVQDISMQ